MKIAIFKKSINPEKVLLKTDNKTGLYQIIISQFIILITLFRFS